MINGLDTSTSGVSNDESDRQTGTEHLDSETGFSVYQHTIDNPVDHTVSCLRRHTTQRK